MSCDLAAYAEQVIALEAVPERAEFIQARIQQDGLKVHPIIADALRPPFPPASFDLITLNGVLEYAGLWDTGDPRDIQRTFLRRLFQLLKPEGYLYIGIEARFSWPYWLGLIDHSGLRFTSLMPRPIASAYCKIRGTPFFGAEHSIDGYRTYTHSPAQYADMVREAGFKAVAVSGVHSGYNDQRIIYDLEDYHGRQHTLNRFNPCASVIGKWRRKITDSRLLYRLLEPEVIIFARRTDSTSIKPLIRAELHSSSRSVTQVNTASKALAIVFQNHVPVEVLDCPKLTWPDATAQSARAYDVVSRLSILFGAEMDHWPMRPPKVTAVRVLSGRPAYGYEYVLGRELSTFALPAHLKLSRLLPLLTRTMSSYVELCRHLQRSWQTERPGAEWGTWRMRFNSDKLEAGIRAAALDAAAYAQRQAWPLRPVHGDFGAANLIVCDSGQIVIVDWTHFSPAFLPAVDLIRFAFDILSDAESLPAHRRRRLLLHVRTILSTSLTSEGFARNEYVRLHALFVAHQLLSTNASLHQQAHIAARYRIDGPLSPLLPVN